jgi:hypothetical protein
MRQGYFTGIAENLKLLPVFFPGWVMRLYFDLDKNDPIFEDICQLACSNPNLDLCHASRLPGAKAILSLSLSL